VRGPEQGRVADPGDRTTAVPVLDQRTAKYVLADPLHDQPFGFGRARQARGLARELGERRVWQTGTKPVRAIKGVVEAAFVGEAVDRETGGGRTEAPAELGRDAGVIGGEPPGPMVLRPSEPNAPTRGCTLAIGMCCKWTRAGSTTEGADYELLRRGRGGTDNLRLERASRADRAGPPAVSRRQQGRRKVVTGASAAFRPREIRNTISLAR